MTRPAHNGSSGRVLVVEDDEGIREMLKYNLSTAGFTVQEGDVTIEQSTGQAEAAAAQLQTAAEDFGNISILESALFFGTFVVGLLLLLFAFGTAG